MLRNLYNRNILKLNILCTQILKENDVQYVILTVSWLFFKRLILSTLQRLPLHKGIDTESKHTCVQAKEPWYYMPSITVFFCPWKRWKCAFDFQDLHTRFNIVVKLYCAYFGVIAHPISQNTIGGKGILKGHLIYFHCPFPIRRAGWQMCNPFSFYGGHIFLLAIIHCISLATYRLDHLDYLEKMR